MQFFATTILLGTLWIGTAAAGSVSSCEFFTDKECSSPANSGTAFDCSNPSVINSNAQSVQCHDVGGKGENVCYLYKLNSKSDKPSRSNYEVGPIDRPDCYELQTQGPYYALAETLIF